jgi:hypothetical protein
VIKQNKAKETINALKDEIQNLSKLVEKGCVLYTHIMTVSWLSHGGSTVIRLIVHDSDQASRGLTLLLCWVFCCDGAVLV